VFEIKLYVGTPSDPVVFDKPGEVASAATSTTAWWATIYVVDTPYFAKTSQGRPRALDVPAGDYDLKVWHFAQASPAGPRRWSPRGARHPFRRASQFRSR
jgi:hypothetical protein